MLIDRVEAQRPKRKRFKLRQASIDLSTTVPGAWGGWMDAADFDRRAHHQFIVHALLTLYESNPDYFNQLDLNIPESGNHIPDIVDEALWGTEYIFRTQNCYGPGFEGAVALAIESVEHPRYSETSWTDSLDCGIDPPSEQQNLIYAASAAHMASVLRPIDPEKSDAYAASAVAAYEWALKSPEGYDDPRFRWPGDRALRNRAAAYLYKFFQSARWHREYLDTNELDALNQASDSGALVYSSLKARDISSKAKAQARQALLADADDAILGMREMAYGTLRHTDVLGPQNLASRGQFVQRNEADAVIGAWRVTGDDAYLDAATQAVQFSLGANPMNLSFVAGLGQRSAMPYLLDMRNTELKPSVGMVTYGPMMPQLWAAGRRHNKFPEFGLYPTTFLRQKNGSDHWPMAEGYIEELYWAPLNEFTVWESAQQLLIAGTLAQHYAAPTSTPPQEDEATQTPTAAPAQEDNATPAPAAPQEEGAAPDSEPS